ncbi:MAG: cytochrome c biogenesis protein CcsA [Candidatus Thermoplasmatota archaeon]|nr:cytochrome c biogenesis protein CcsA [Candidatus Thermoplasmatota archaeon]
MAHDISGIMILIHPPLAILGYLMTFLALKKAVDVLRSGDDRRRELRSDLSIALCIAWALTFLGLVTGMIWARMAWGAFWSWDPKEIGTLAVFLTLTMATTLNLLGKSLIWQIASLVLCVLSIFATASMSFISISIHSYG